MELMDMSRSNPEFIPQLQLKKYLGEIKESSFITNVKKYNYFFAKKERFE